MVTANILTALLAVHVFLNSKSVLLFVKLNHTAYRKSTKDWFRCSEKTTAKPRSGKIIRKVCV